MVDPASPTTSAQIDRLAVSTNTYHPYTLEEALAGIAAAGATSVELTSVPGWSEHVSRDANEVSLDHVRSLLAQHGLTAISFSGHSDLVSDAGVVEFRKALTIAHALGVSYVTTSTGGHDASSAGDLEEQRSRFLERIGPLADEAATMGITICLETHGGLLATGAMAADLIREIGKPNVGINYDPGNVIYYGDTRPEADFVSAVDHLAHLHVKDKIGGAGEWNFPAVGTGEVDFGALFEAADAAAFTGPCSIEIEFQGDPWPPLDEVNAAVAESVRFVRQFVPAPQPTPPPPPSPPRWRGAPGGAVSGAGAVLPFPGATGTRAGGWGLFTSHHSEPTMTRIAVLGAGFMGGTHARAYGAMPGVEVAAVYARSGTRAEPLATELGTTWTDDLERVLSDPSIDAVDICLPTPEHRTATEAALAAGKHVLVEKPLALTLADADALVAAAAKTDRIVMVAHVLRFWPEYVELQRIVAGGELGRPLSAVATRRQPFPAWSELFARADLTGGAVVDMLVHDYDALNWLFGAPKSVVCRGHRNTRTGGWDQTQVLIDYGDASAVVDGGMTMPESYPFSSSLQVLCERGAIEYHFRAGGRSVEMGAGVNDLILYPESGDPVRLDIPQADPYAAECAYFIDCVRSGRAAGRATPADARRAVQVALAARHSLDSAPTTGPIAI